MDALQESGSIRIGSTSSGEYYENMGFVEVGEGWERPSVDQLRRKSAEDLDGSGCDAQGSDERWEGRQRNESSTRLTAEKSSENKK